MRNINDVILNFVLLLQYSWKQLEKIFTQDKTSSIKNDWLQANWELLVEGILSAANKVRLEVYGEGADANGSSSRILYPNDLPTHAIHCKPKQGNSLQDNLAKKYFKFPQQGILFDRFVSMKNGWYYETLPFDKVLVIIDGQEKVFNLSDIDFILYDLK